MKKRFRQMLDIHRFLAERRLAKTPFLDVTSFVDKKACDQCRLCRRSFSFLWRKKEHCRKCGNVVCSSCFNIWNTTVRRQIVKVPVCLLCVHIQPPAVEYFHESDFDTLFAIDVSSVVGETGTKDVQEDRHCVLRCACENPVSVSSHASSRSSTRSLLSIILGTNRSERVVSVQSL
ncbi:Aste57867_17006 [Aphanomyces stellatus]|uniref:Aste57867_17006 protein n=1 Tax=Aphanomyces stellatus TaxID=120398 RepID=A0A485L8A5_9STRA|nr:hypothetical protein As57867_016948 [Aphanomyces stellatus]VFT93767.1 Aste57867_17006 [Aphanomyces stellatus]